jgi:hypothetical protein
LRYQAGADTTSVSPRDKTDTGGYVKKLEDWWYSGLDPGVKIVFILLLANGVPAFFNLMTFPDKTDTLFVWTVKPVINARLVGVMYSNALILVIIGFFQKTWARVRIIMLLITLFSILATVLTFFYLKPFLEHPWFHLSYWLAMYLALCVVAPYVFYTQEKEHGGRLPVQIPLNVPARLVGAVASVVSLACALGLLFSVETVNQYWPWKLPPLVGGLIGVLFMTHAAAFVWAQWDGDWLRVRPMFWQAPLTALLFILLPLLHSGDLRTDAGNALTLYYGVASLVALLTLSVILSYRGAEKRFAGLEQSR